MCIRDSTSRPVVSVSKIINLFDIIYKLSIPSTDKDQETVVDFNKNFFTKLSFSYFEFIQKNEEVQQQLRAPLFEDKVVDFVFELSTISEKKVTKDALQKAIESDD